MTDIDLPEGLDWRHWVARYDRMQERYLVGRAERFAVIVRTVLATQGDSPRLLDLGCGTGSLTEAVLSGLPGSRAVGMDLDASLLPLARARLAHVGERAEFLHRDLREDGWAVGLGEPFDAAVSATALHWLSPQQLSALYRRLAGILKPGGIFLNADHVASDCPAVQKAREQRRAEMRKARACDLADTWDGFFQAYAEAIGADPGRMGSRAVGRWQGVEEGMPLAWHFDRLREAGFVGPDCFWRCDCDAVYGALYGPGGSPH